MIDFTTDNRVLNSMIMEENGEKKFLNGMIVADEHDQPIPVGINEMRRIVNYFYPTGMTRPAIVVADLIYRSFRKDDLINVIAADAKLESLHVSIHSTVLEYLAIFNSVTAGTQRAQFTVMQIGYAERLHVSQLLSTIHENLTVLAGNFTVDFDFTWTPDNINYTPAGVEDSEDGA